MRGCFFVDRIGFESITFNEALAQKPKDLIRTVMLEPGKPAYEAEIPNTLHGMQRAVKGYIEAAYPFSDNAVLIANEEGLLLDMAPNRFINLQTYVGPVFIVGDNGDGEFCSLTDEQTAQYLVEFSEPEMFEQDEDMDFGMNML